MLQGGPTLPAHLVAAVCAAAELRRPPLEGKSLAVADAAPLHDLSHLPTRMPAADALPISPRSPTQNRLVHSQHMRRRHRSVKRSVSLSSTACRARDTHSQVLPFPQYELQARWISRVLSGRAHLPSADEMEVRFDRSSTGQTQQLWKDAVIMLPQCWRLLPAVHVQPRSLITVHDSCRHAWERTTAPAFCSLHKLSSTFFLCTLLGCWTQCRHMWRHSTGSWSGTASSSDSRTAWTAHCSGATTRSALSSEC